MTGVVASDIDRSIANDIDLASSVVIGPGAYGLRPIRRYVIEAYLQQDAFLKADNSLGRALIVETNPTAAVVFKVIKLRVAVHALDAVDADCCRQSVIEVLSALVVHR